MRKFAVPAAALLALALPASAADKGSPPATLEQLLAQQSKSLAGCHVETSVAGTYLANATARDAIVGIGGGCDAILANLVIGGGIRADWGDLANTGSIYAKLGISINNGATVYGLAEWKVPGWKIKDAGQLAIGGGAELSLSIINPNLSMFAEGTFAATKFGAATRDDVTTRLGLRYRF